MQQKREIRWESGGSESWGKWGKYDQNSLYAILKEDFEVWRMER